MRRFSWAWRLYTAAAISTSLATAQRGGTRKFAGRPAIRKQAGGGGPGAANEQKSHKVKFANQVNGTFDISIKVKAIELLATEDPIGQQWLEFGPDRMNTKSAQRYAQIKTMILAYQDWQSFGKFDYYGCYCFPEGQNLAMGTGTPVDKIDTACKRWMNCMNCITMDDNFDGTCDAVSTSYEFDAIKDAEGNAKIKCVKNGPHGSCKRATCECDAEFVETMSKLERDNLYEIENHELWGNFDRLGHCSKKKAPKVVLKSALTDGAGESSENESEDNLSNKNHAAASIQNQMQNQTIGHGVVDKCCVSQYPNFQLFRSLSQKCCYSQLKNSYITNVYHPGIQESADDEQLDCCWDGSVAPGGECERAQVHEDL